MMKKIFLVAAAAAVSVLGFAQGNRIVERTYVSTDKACYVAGDDVWCSAFCIDVTAGGKLSEFSSVAYVELMSTKGQAASCKIALQDGRGAGHFRIPADTPTGNYRLVAYTAVNRNESDMDYMEGSRVISVFNTLSTERLPGVSVVAAGSADGTAAGSAADGASEESVAMTVDGNRITLTNNGTQTATMALSVYCKDGLKNPQSIDIEGFASEFKDGAKTAAFSSEVTPEYDGEIVRIQVDPRFSGMTAFLSSPGNSSNVYTTEVGQDGKAVFYTGNIYGEKDLVFQVDSPEADADYKVDVETPFVSPEVKDVPSLEIGDAMSADLLRRSIAMQISGKFGTELITEAIPHRPDLLFSGAPMVSYKLDDYTRFSTVREVISEYVRQMTVRKDDGGYAMRVLLEDPITYNKTTSPFSGYSLIMLDGVPVTDHDVIVDMDPSLIERLDIFPHPVVIGSRVYGGVANFITYRKDLSGVNLPDGTRFIDFKGVSLPVALTGEKIDGETYPDYRQTLLWQPLVTLKPGESVTYECVMPAYEADFVAHAEGICSKAFTVDIALGK